MSYLEIGYQFMNYFIDSINVNHSKLLGIIKYDSQMSINSLNAMGPENIFNGLSSIGIHQLKIDPKYVMVQPIYWKNIYRNEYDGIMILASGSTNLIENGYYINKNIHLSFILEIVNGGYYINNLIIRLSEKARNIQPAAQPQLGYNPNAYSQQSGYSPYGCPMNTRA